MLHRKLRAFYKDSLGRKDILLVHPVIKNVVNCCTFKNSCLTQLGYQTCDTVAFMKQLAFPSSVNVISVTQETANKLDNLNLSHSWHLNGTMTLLLNSTIPTPFKQNKTISSFVGAF